MLVYKTQIIYHYIGHTTLKHKTCMHSPKKKKNNQQKQQTKNHPKQTFISISYVCTVYMLV